MEAQKGREGSEASFSPTKQPIQPYRRYGPPQHKRIEHAVPNAEPDADYDSNSQVRTPKRLAKQDTATFGVIDDAKLTRSETVVRKSKVFD